MVDSNGRGNVHENGIEMAPQGGGRKGGIEDGEQVVLLPSQAERSTGRRPIDAL